MPRFYFHIVGKVGDRDTEGTELPSAAYAKREGLKLIGSMLNDGFYDTQGAALLLEITDESGLVLFHIDVTARDTPVGRAA